MSLSKTDNQLRNFTQLEKYPVYENLPEHFGEDYPNLVRFLELYYEHTSEETAEKYLQDLDYSRDFVSAR